MTNEPGTRSRVPGTEGELSAPPLVSVIVAARNSASTLPACLRALASQDHPLVEVIVVDDGSEDETAALADAAGVRVVRTPAVGASAARNLGIAIARGEIVAFTDGDCVAEAGWARALVEGLRSSGATGVGGKQVNVFPPGRRALRDGFEAFFRAASIVSDYTRGDERPRPVQHNASCCSAYRIEPVRAIGGFTPGLWPGEDVDLDLRLAAQGATFYYVPWAIVHHHRPGTFAWFRRMMRRYGAAERRLVRMHGRKRVVDYVPALLAAVVAIQLLMLWPAAYGPVVAFDAVLLLGAIGVLWSTTPIRHWLTVMVFGVTALWEWHVGWLTAPRRHGVTPHDAIIDQERAHENAWYTRALEERFFEREGFRRLVAWNVAAFRREVALRPDMRALSIGSGLGDYELAIAPLVRHVTAVELSETAAAAARERLRAAAIHNVDVVVGPIDTQDFAPGQFDLVYAMGVFHHFLPDQRHRLLAMAHAWTSPSGWLYVRDPNARGLLRLVLERWFRSRSTVHAEQETSLDPYVLKAEAQQAGFTDAHLDYIDVIGGPLPWLVRSESGLFWRAVFAFDRAWLALPGLRRAASQFALVARR